MECGLPGALRPTEVSSLTVDGESVMEQQYLSSTKEQSASVTPNLNLPYKCANFARFKVLLTPIWVHQPKVYFTLSSHPSIVWYFDLF